MNAMLKTSIWRQFGATIDMLENALHACPDELWHESLWEEPSERREYSEFWFLIYHTLYWTDLYLTGSAEGFEPAAVFERGELDADRLPVKGSYTKAELQVYLDYCRKKGQATIEELTDESAARRCRFRWMNGEITFVELLLYSMRHIQEHAAQLNLMLGEKVGSAPDWVPWVGGGSA